MSLTRLDSPVRSSGECAQPTLRHREAAVTRFPVLLSILALVAPLLANAAATPGRPNILFIYTDDHSYRTVGAYPQSYPWVRTPTIDRLAAEG